MISIEFLLRFEQVLGHLARGSIRFRRQLRKDLLALGATITLVVIIFISELIQHRLLRGIRVILVSRHRLGTLVSRQMCPSDQNWQALALILRISLHSA